MDLGSRYFVPLVNTCKQLFLIILSSPVIMRPVRLYMNRELTQSANRSFKLEVGNVEILKHAFTGEDIGCNMCSICIRDYKNSLIS